MGVGEWSIYKKVTYMKKALVLGAGGFIGSHLVKRLKKEGYWVRGVDLKYPEFTETAADDFVKADLRDPEVVKTVFRLEVHPDKEDIIYEYSYHKQPFTAITSFDEVYQLAADMGGAGYIFTGDNDANVMHNSALVNLNVVHSAVEYKAKKVFFSSSACIYPEHNQLDPDNPNCEESSAYPADPDSQYGWEKLFSEILYDAWRRNYNLDVRVARFHNIFGPEGTWKGGKEKAPAAMCRKIAAAKDKDVIEVWGDGEQTRSFLYIDDCLDAVRMLMESDFYKPVNIGSEQMVTINELVDIIAKISGKNITKKHIDGPLGVRGRNSHNKLFIENVGNNYVNPLEYGLDKTYKWISQQLKKKY